MWKADANITKKIVVVLEISPKSVKTLFVLGPYPEVLRYQSWQGSKGHIGYQELTRVSRRQGKYTHHSSITPASKRRMLLSVRHQFDACVICLSTSGSEEKNPCPKYTCWEVVSLGKWRPSQDLFSPGFSLNFFICLNFLFALGCAIDFISSMDDVTGGGCGYLGVASEISVEINWLHVNWFSISSVVCGKALYAFFFVPHHFPKAVGSFSVMELRVSGWS